MSRKTKPGMKSVLSSSSNYVLQGHSLSTQPPEWATESALLRLKSDSAPGYSALNQDPLMETETVQRFSCVLLLILDNGSPPGLTCMTLEPRRRDEKKTQCLCAAGRWMKGTVAGQGWRFVGSVDTLTAK